MATQSLKTIESQIRKLQARAQTMRERDRKPVIAAIVKQMKAHEISLDEIGEAFGKRRAPRTATKVASTRASKTARKPVAPKFRDPESGATWSGRGRTPRWIVEAEQSGKDRSSFAI